MSRQNIKLSPDRHGAENAKINDNFTELYSVHNIRYLADADARRAIEDGAVGQTQVIQDNLIGIIWTLIATDESLDASWIGQPYTVDPDGDVIINMELADMTGIVPDLNVLGQVGNRPTIGDASMTNGGRRLAFKDDVDLKLSRNKPEGYATMTTVKTSSNLSIDVRHGGTATYISWSLNGVAQTKVSAPTAETPYTVTVPDPNGAPTDIAIWPSDVNGVRTGDLTYLNLGNNSLTSLDVSGLTALTTLQCFNNSLTSLDVSGLTALTTLSCFTNSLTSLDASGLIALDYLACSTNSLTSLDVSGLTALTTLSCNSNALTSLDVSGLTALDILQCNSNALTSLDVSGLTALTNLNCSTNSLTSLDVSGLTAFTSLNCSTNSLTSLLATGVNLSDDYIGSSIGDNLLTETALIAFVNSLATTVAGKIYYASNTGSAAFATWLTTGDDKNYFWINS
jgi:hypothetical protein